MEERLAREKAAEEERERFVKEATERKAAERDEAVKQAKRLILYRKPMCRRINRALLLSECFRELDAQVKFQETIKNIDKEAEMSYVKLMKADVANFEVERKQKAEEELSKRQNYAASLRKQIEENEKCSKTKEKEKFEAERQDQMNINKYLQDLKEHEARELLNKKERLKQFFKDTIEEKKRFDLKFKQEDEFEDRANEIYKDAKARIKKMHKAAASKEKEELERRARGITEKHHQFIHRTEEFEERSLQKALAEQEAQYKENETARKEYQNRLRKELQDFQAEATVAKSKQLQEEKELRLWEIMQRFKKDEYDKQLQVERRTQEKINKIEYGNVLKKHMGIIEADRKREKILEDEETSMRHVIEKENQRVLDYADEVIEESKGVRPLYPILKAVQECKAEMGLVSPKKREEIVLDTALKRRRRVPRTCTKPVPEDKILYLQ
ncbi:uncharacterized protein LOC143375183 isoform X2 [Andrena cerasifolii]